MFFVIGVYLLFLAILLDDVTSYIIFLKGMSIFETNLIYVKFGMPIFIMSSMVIYALVIFYLKSMQRTYYKLYKNKMLMYKIYDIFVFLGCFLLMFIVVNKVEMGINNIDIMIDYREPEYKERVEIVKQEITHLKETNRPVYEKKMGNEYKETFIQGINYFKMLMILIFAYLYFRVGYKVSPYELA